MSLRQFSVLKPVLNKLTSVIPTPLNTLSPPCYYCYCYSNYNSRDGANNNSREGPNTNSRDGPYTNSREGPNNNSREGPNNNSIGGPSNNSGNSPNNNSIDSPNNNSTEGPSNNSTEGPNYNSRDSPNNRDQWKLRSRWRRRTGLSPLSRVQAMMGAERESDDDSNSLPGTVKSDDFKPSHNTSLKEGEVKGGNPNKHFSRKHRTSLSPLHRYSAALTDDSANQNTDRDSKNSIEDLKNMEESFKKMK